MHVYNMYCLLNLKVLPSAHPSNGFLTISSREQQQCLFFFQLYTIVMCDFQTYSQSGKYKCYC